MRIKMFWGMICLLAVPSLAHSQDAGDSNAARKWYAPDAVTLQFAGNIGMFSIAPGYSFAHDKINAELSYGFVPKFDAAEALHLLTLKGIYKPFRKVPLHNDFSLTPLRVGMGLSYYFRSQFSTNWSNAYPASDYYWWTSSLRLTGGLGPAVNYALPNSNTFKELSLYGEVGTYDLIATSAFKDETLTKWDILSFGIGLRASFK
ncbi:hypothetical protein I2I11_12905 [Pontibacter sp. 172403-2]|uniref:hypothetical protein n=1 Tax=Pontibacter rufus TaxID=2791028 RepID=UPI0018AFC68F|nr:hypothetical protein [Pontibacter sp. 172403-2]MBF9254197.1 hypothetical protein [Pontibacter sp. 172403-2]